MNQFRFLATSLIAGASLILSSCGSGDSEKKTDEKMADSSGAKMSTTQENKAVTTPAKPADLMVIKHKVANYAKWKVSYDAHDSARKASGLSDYVLARGVDDSNTVLVALKMTDIYKAKALASSQELADRMKKAGVIGMPSISYLEQVWQDTTTLSQMPRVSVKHKVKDWAAWKKVFDEDKPARMEAGLIDRVVGHDVGDDHSVSVVFAITDMAKAKAFMNSKALKDKMAQAGVDGPPSFFIYNIVELHK